MYGNVFLSNFVCVRINPKAARQQLNVNCVFLIIAQAKSQMRYLEHRARLANDAFPQFVMRIIIELAFDDGLRKRVNLRRELNGAIFEPLRDPAYFAKVRVDPDSRTVAWPNGADFAPDFLHHYEAESVAADLHP